MDERLILEAGRVKDGLRVLVTGGGSGIGADLTKGFLSQGAKVTFVQRSNPEKFLAECEGKYKYEPTFIKCDVSHIEKLKIALQTTAKEQGAVTVLVNNAANDTRHTLDEFTSQQWDQTMEVNLKPHFFAAQEVVEGMKISGGGSIINFSSISYMMGNEGYPAYATAKSAITGLTRSLARELGPHSIRVNAIMPGWVLTERQMKLWATEEGLSNLFYSKGQLISVTPSFVLRTLASDGVFSPAHISNVALRNSL